MKQYKIERWRFGIIEVDVVKETKEFVTVVDETWSGKTGHRRESNRDYFHSFEDAKKELVARAQLRVDSAKDELSLAIERLESAKYMTIGMTRERR